MTIINGNGTIVTADLTYRAGVRVGIVVKSIQQVAGTDVLLHECLEVADVVG